jgi:hypothetical protein
MFHHESKLMLDDIVTKAFKEKIRKKKEERRQ